MPRTPPADPPVYVAPRPSIIASASRIVGAATTTWSRPEEWQNECWRYRDEIGEVRYAAEWFANAMSRAMIYPARHDADGTLVPIRSGREVDELALILGGLGISSQSMKSLGEHLFVVGECYLLGRKPKTAEEKAEGDVTWEVVSADSVKKRGDKWTIDHGNNEKYEVAASDDLFRIHKPHPRRKSKADAPLRAVMTSLREIDYLSMHVWAQVRSRLAGAGVLFMSDGVTFTTPVEDAENATVAEGVDPFMLVLARAMAAAIADPSSPEAMVPIIARVPGDEVEKQKWLTFWSELDGQTQEMRDSAIRRTALGIDLPPEVLLGTADVNHWGAWQIEESTIKAHIEPALEIVTAALTRILRKVLDDPTIVCVFDTSALRLRPNRSKEAFELWDRGEINGEALRRETGFSEADAPKEEDRKQWYLRKVASGSASPEMVEEALRMLGIDFPRVTADAGINESRPDPSLEPLPENGPPPQMTVREVDIQRAALEATCDALVYRALERCGNRLRNATTSRPEGVDPQEMHLFVSVQNGRVDNLLDGAWGILPKLLRNQPYSHEKIEKALDAYVRSLITSQQQHDPDTMMRFVDAGLAA